MESSQRTLVDHHSDVDADRKKFIKWGVVRYNRTRWVHRFMATQEDRHVVRQYTFRS